MHPAVSIARDLVAIPSVNPMGRPLAGAEYGEKNIAAYVDAFFRRLGIDSRIFGAQPERPNVVGFVNVNAAETVLLEAHMDTVSHEGMEIAPFDPVVRAGLLYGRGSCDTKSSLAVCLYAISQVIQSGKKLRRNVVIAGVHDEEYSFGGSRELVADGIKATYAIVGEPTSLNIVYAHKGVCRFRINTIGRSAHAALPWLGENAIYVMADLLKTLRDHAKELLTTEHPELGPATLSVGRISGGTSVNTVPALCAIDVDRRLLPGESYESVRTSLQQAVRALEGSYEIESPYVEAPGVHNPKDGPACEAVLAASARHNWKPELRTAHYCTDASNFCGAGIPVAVFGPGAVEVAHTKKEYVPVREIELASDIVVALLTEV